MNFEIRPPTPAEARAWEELRMASWRHAYAGTFTPQMFAAQEQQLEARATGFADWLESTGGTGEDVQQQLGQRRRALVAVEAGEKDAPGKLLGLAFASQMPYEVQKLEMLYLLPEAFGTGAAQALMGQVLDLGPAELEVLSTNARAIRFYEKEGFAITRKDEFAGRKTYIMTRP
ncbi:MAG: GNAT family N-acetyltransferase [Rothia sp. (in: high G+C Gram-positive bacteria)]|nr:GNAT family N-acetyltransferase [Rothia sp. (in: high G+C Gram-positive bacteria)]